MSERKVDVVVIGAGPAGETAAGRLAAADLDTVLVERELVGGECSYWACMPSKALLRPFQARDEARRVPGAREAVTGDLDVASALARRDEVIHGLDDDAQLPWLDERGVTLVRGHARLDGPGRVVVDGGDAYVARTAVVVATGSGQAFPPIDGLEDAKPWTNREATTAKRAPDSLVVIGGGVVGCELSQAWSSLGTTVTLLEAGPELIPREEDFAREQVAEALKGRGIDVRLDQKATRVTRNDDGTITVELETSDAVTAAELLVAAGRRPHVADLGLESVGLPTDEHLRVDERMLVEGTDRLYAVGDVNGRTLLTHMGKHQARVAADNILGHAITCTKADGPLAPRVMFTEPQVAAVGHTLASAREAGLNVRAVDHPVGAVAGGSFYGKGAPGLVRIVVDEDRRVLAGATFTGADVAEFLHAATIAVVGEVTLDRLYASVPAFPTRSEVWLRLLEKYGL
jgi:pyruvate/2-oxoglutarate dehydrogenase complex dihydrolipoamide dehydrogenase (E3) component